MSGSLDAPSLRRAMEVYGEALQRHRQALNSLNVFPVPDGDTGTNLVLTQRAVVAALRDPMDLDAMRAVIATASLMGARGNSGVILSQVLRGLCEAMGVEGISSADQMAAALRLASAQAERAVARPRQGTMLSVLRDAADAATREAGRAGDLGRILEAALGEARASLARTTDLLPELREAGVVDAGAKGVVLLLAALRAAVTDRPVDEPVGPPGPVGRSEARPPSRDLEFAFEVEYLLEADEEAIPPVREALASVGDSVVVVGGGGLYHIHVHTNQPEAALAIGRSAGRTDRAVTVDLADAVASCIGGQARGVRVAEDAWQAWHACALVAVAAGPGVAKLFESLGAVVVAPDARGDLDALDLARAIEAAPSGSVLVLPNEAARLATAETTRRGSTKAVQVLPTRSIPDGVAAATVFNPSQNVEANVAEMERAVSKVEDGEVVAAASGGWVGRVGEVAVAANGSLAGCVEAVARRLVRGDAEVLTIILGEGISAEEGARLTEALALRHPSIRIDLVEGGQPAPAIAIGLE